MSFWISWLYPRDHPLFFEKCRLLAKNFKVKRPCTPAQSLELSLKEMKLMRQRKMKKRSWKEFRQELNKEN